MNCLNRRHLALSLAMFLAIGFAPCGVRGEDSQALKDAMAAVKSERETKITELMNKIKRTQSKSDKDRFSAELKRLKAGAIPDRFMPLGNDTTVGHYGSAAAEVLNVIDDKTAVIWRGPSSLGASPPFILRGVDTGKFASGYRFTTPICYVSGTESYRGQKVFVLMPLVKNEEK